MRLPVADLVTGDGSNALAPGELLTRVDLPAAALTARAAFRQVSLSAVGRSAVLVIARRRSDTQREPRHDSAPNDTAARDDTVITVTAATPRPLQLRFAAPPAPADAVAALDAADPPYLDDVHGSARWRAAMTRRCVAGVIAELAASPGAAR